MKTWKIRTPRIGMVLIENIETGEEGTSSYYVCEMVCSNNSRPYRQENAELIAAAPDLLVALEDLLELAEPMCVEQEDYTLVQARKAIAKAKGEEQ